MTRRQPPDRVDDARQATADLRQATREAHEAMKGLRDASREAKALLDAEMPERVRARVEEILVPKVEAMSETIDRNIKAATDAVFRRFDVLAANLLGEATPGEEPLEETVRRYQARVREAELAGTAHPETVRRIAAVHPAGERL